MTCSRCQQTKHATEFHRDRHSRTGRRSECAQCSNDLNRYKRYGVTPEQFEAMYIRQEGKCAICGESETRTSIHLDHCHTNGHPRGLLCKQCNKGLGHFNDNPQTMRKAAQYLLISAPPL